MMLQHEKRSSDKEAKRLTTEMRSRHKNAVKAERMRSTERVRSRHRIEVKTLIPGNKKNEVATGFSLLTTNIVMTRNSSRDH